MAKVKDYYFEQLIDLPDQPEPDPITHHIDSLTSKLVAAQQDDSVWAEIDADEVAALEWIVKTYNQPTGEQNDRPF